MIKMHPPTGSLVKAGTWDGVRQLAQLHDTRVKQAAFDVRGVDMLSPEVQAAIGIGLNQFAEYYGVRGSLVRAWGVTEILNKRFEAAWQPSERNRFQWQWWTEQTIAFACILHPANEGEPVIDGMLLFDHVTYEFTPDSEFQEQVHWDRRQVRDVDEPANGATVLHLAPATGYSHADIASTTLIVRETADGPVFTDPNQPLRRSKPRPNWGSVG
ncbi:hypothetical protein ACWC0C_41160 [Streptomyces sp. NPDC001709]